MKYSCNQIDKIVRPLAPKFCTSQSLRLRKLHTYLESQVAVITDRIRMIGEGNVFSLSMEGGGTYPKVSTPLPAKVHTSQARSGWGRGYPKVPTPWPRYLPPPQPRYLHPTPARMGGTPRYLHLPWPRYLTPPPG